MAFQLSSAKAYVFSNNNNVHSSSCFSHTSNYKHRIVYACAENQSRRLALFQLTTVLSQPQLFSANAKVIMPTEGQDLGKTIMPISDVAQAPNSLSEEEEEDMVKWVQNDKRRLLHVVYRVGNLDKTIKFYTECLGMKILRKRDIPEEGYSNAFLGYGPEESNFAMELTYNYGVDNYEVGPGFGHFGFKVENVAKLVKFAKLKGARVTQEPGLVKDGDAIISVMKDPDGYTCKLIERWPTAEPLAQVMLRVGDLDRSIDFYRKAYGMELLQKKDNPEYKCTTVVMGYGPEEENAVITLTYNYGVREYDKGNGYGQVAIGTDDVYKTAEAIKSYGGKIVLEPGPLPGLNTKITACLDPDGWKTVFVDNIDFMKELEL